MGLKLNQNPLIPRPYGYPQSWTKPYPSLPANKLSVFFVGRLKKLYTTITWKNITIQDDSQRSQLGSYECHAFAVNKSEIERGMTLASVLLQVSLLSFHREFCYLIVSQ